MVRSKSNLHSLTIVSGNKECWQNSSHSFESEIGPNLWLLKRHSSQSSNEEANRECLFLTLLELKKERWKQRRRAFRLHGLIASRTFGFSLMDMNKQLILYRKEAVDDLLKTVNVRGWLFFLTTSVTMKSGRRSS